MNVLNPIGSHILNKDVRDVVLEDVQNNDKCMDLLGDCLAVKMNYTCIKIMKSNNFGKTFFLKNSQKINDFSLLTNKHIAVIDKECKIYALPDLNESSTELADLPKLISKKSAASENKSKAKKDSKKQKKENDN